MSSLWDTIRRAIRPASAAGSSVSSPRLSEPLRAPDLSVEAGPVWPRDGGRLGPFQLHQELGRGSVGRVYGATLYGSTEPLALKTLALAREFQGPALEEARIRFFRQVHAARRLNHPDIVAVLDTGECDGVAWLSMPLLHGHSLERHTQPDALLSVTEVLHIAARVSRALAHAHAQGVVHRDVKPANIMIDRASGAVKVTDFGIAHLADVAATRTGLVLGSPAFMSPEQLAGRRVDGRSDLYALGVTLYQLLTGRLPHASHRLSDLMAQIANEPAPDVRSVRPSLPEALAHVLSLSLEKRPELRYANGLQMAHDLDAVAAQWREMGPDPDLPQDSKLSWGAGLA